MLTQCLLLFTVYYAYSDIKTLTRVSCFTFDLSLFTVLWFSQNADDT